MYQKSINTPYFPVCGMHPTTIRTNIEQLMCLCLEANLIIELDWGKK